jgi:hypothetical protein
MEKFETYADIKRLQEEERIETLTLEYKDGHPTKPNGKSLKDAKRDLAKEVVAMANTAGGHIIYGIDEGKKNNDNDIQLKPIEIEDKDGLKTQIDHYLKDMVEPKLIGVKSYVIKSDDNPERYFFIIKITRSSEGPYAIKKDKKLYFYYRSEASCRPYNYYELRQGFLWRHTINEKMENFRKQRVNKIYANTGKLSLQGGPKAILHLIPLSAMELGQPYDIENIYNNIINIDPLIARGNGGTERKRRNYDGILVHPHLFESKEGCPDILKPGGYFQLYRNGIIESVYSEFYDEHMTNITQEKVKYIAPKQLREDLGVAIKKYLKILNDIGLNDTLYIFISIINF